MCHNEARMAKKNFRSKTRARVGASERTLQVLEILAAEPYLFSLADLSAALSLPKSTTHRFMNVLADCGFIEQERGTKRYMLTPKVLWIGTSYLRNSAVERVAIAALAQLSDQAGTTSHLGIWDNGATLILHTAAPPNALNLFVDVGERRPVHSTALGKVLLAYRTPEDLKKFRDGSLAQFGPNTITSFSALEDELERVRETGFGIDNQESAPGVRCVAAPVRNQAGVVAAICVSGSTSLITDAALPGLARLVQDAALRISVQLGHRPAAQVSVLRPVALARMEEAS